MPVGTVSLHTIRYARFYLSQNLCSPGSINKVSSIFMWSVLYVNITYTLGSLDCNNCDMNESLIPLSINWHEFFEN